MHRREEWRKVGAWTGVNVTENKSICELMGLVNTLQTFAAINGEEHIHLLSDCVL